MGTEDEKSRSKPVEGAETHVDDAERSIAEFERLSGRGDSQGWKFDREEAHERK